MLLRLLPKSRQLSIAQCMIVQFNRSVTSSPTDQMDHMLKSRENLPIIKTPYYCSKSFKKIRREIFFEETIATKKAKELKRKRNNNYG